MASSSPSSIACNPLALPLCKLSHCTTPALTSRMKWTHIPAQEDMFAVFDQVRKSGVGGAIMNKRVLKVIHGGHILEHVDLHDLLFQARLDEEKSRSQPVQDSDLSIVLIIKRPLVALRYQRPDGQTRRVQLKFRLESGYDITVNEFRALGLPISDRNLPIDHWEPSLHSASSQLAYPPIASSNSQTYHLPAPPRNMPAALTPSLLPSVDLTTRASTSCGYVGQLASSALETQCVRPFTAPISLSQMLPPKRELPFLKKHMKPSPPPEMIIEPEHVKDGMEEIVVIDSAPSSQAPIAIPQSPVGVAEEKSAVVKRKRAKAPATKRSIKKAPEPTKVSTNVLSDLETVQVPATPEAIRTASATNAFEAKRLIVTLKNPAPKASRETKPRNNPKLPTAPETPLAQSPKIFEDLEPADFMARLDDWVRQYQHLPAPGPHQPEAENTAAYAAQPKEERMAILDNMIVERLGNKDFLALAQDMDQSWRRIGLEF